MTRSSILLLSLCFAVACGSDEVVIPTADKVPAGAGAEKNETPESSNPEEATNEEVAPKNEEKPVVPQSSPKWAANLSVTDVAIFQAVRIPLVEERKVVTGERRVVVAGRPGVVRVYVKPEPNFRQTDVDAVLTLEKDGATTILSKRLFVRESSSDSGEAFDFDLAADQISGVTKFRVDLRPVGDAADVVDQPSTSAFPDDAGLVEFGASERNKLRVKIVPVRYATDGSNRLPDITDAQIARYKNELMRLYPVSEVEVTVREAVTWNQQIAANGQGWDTILNSMLGLRRRDRAADDVYYYGVFAPRPSFGSFCNGGCVLGLSGLVDDARNADLRASIGIGFSGEEAAETLAHELGHAHGREHAPCGGAGGPDRSFPYRGGGIGTWGYDILSKRFINPAPGGSRAPKDFMGYCDPSWISDYSYRALAERVRQVNLSPRRVQAETSYHLGRVSGDGVVTFDDVVTYASPPALAEYTLENASPSRQVMQQPSEKALFARYDHLPGGILMVPTSMAAGTELAIPALRASFVVPKAAP
jgi:hypothetical protein